MITVRRLSVLSHGFVVSVTLTSVWFSVVLTILLFSVHPREFTSFIMLRNCFLLLFDVFHTVSWFKLCDLFSF